MNKPAPWGHDHWGHTAAFQRGDVDVIAARHPQRRVFIGAAGDAGNRRQRRRLGDKQKHPQVNQKLL